MSGYSRSSVSVLPDTGTIVETTVLVNTTGVIAQPKSGETWKIIGVTANNENIGICNVQLKLIDEDDNAVLLNDATPINPTTVSPMNIRTFTAGDILVDEKIQLNASVTLGNLKLLVAYMKVN